MTQHNALPDNSSIARHSETMTGMVHIYAPFQRVDPIKREVTGYCYTTGIVKGDNWNLKRSAAEKASKKYMQMPAVRAMHGNVAAGKGVSLNWDATGCLLTAKIVDDNEWRKVEEGVYRGFSMGGNPVVAFKRGDGKHDIEEFDWHETSLVDRPADPGATFTLKRVSNADDAPYEVTILEADPDALSDADATPEQAENTATALVSTTALVESSNLEDHDNGNHIKQPAGSTASTTDRAGSEDGIGSSGDLARNGSRGGQDAGREEDGPSAREGASGGQQSGTEGIAGARGQTGQSPDTGEQASGLRGENGEGAGRRPGEGSGSGTPDPSGSLRRDSAAPTGSTLRDPEAFAASREPLAINRAAMTEADLDAMTQDMPEGYADAARAKAAQENNDDATHDYGAVMASLAPADALRSITWAQQSIPYDALSISQESSGIEMQPHITLLYGLGDVDPDDVDAVCGDMDALSVSVGNLSLFRADSYDVLKYDVISDDAVMLHDALKQLPHTETHPDYHPHITVAYVQKGRADLFDGMAGPLTGQQLWLDELTYSDKNEVVTPIYLDGEDDEDFEDSPLATPLGMLPAAHDALERKGGSALVTGPDGKTKGHWVTHNGQHEFLAGGASAGDAAQGHGASTDGAHKLSKTKSGGGVAKKKTFGKRSVSNSLKSHDIHEGSVAHDVVMEAHAKGHIKSKARLHKILAQSKEDGHSAESLHKAINEHGGGDGKFESEKHGPQKASHFVDLKALAAMPFADVVKKHAALIDKWKGVAGKAWEVGKAVGAQIEALDKATRFDHTPVLNALGAAINAVQKHLDSKGSNPRQGKTLTDARREAILREHGIKDRTVKDRIKASHHADSIKTEAELHKVLNTYAKKPGNYDHLHKTVVAVRKAREKKLTRGESVEEDVTVEPLSDAELDAVTRVELADSEALLQRFDSSQPRDGHGMWTIIGGHRVSIHNKTVDHQDIHDAADRFNLSQSARAALLKAHDDGKITHDDHLKRTIAAATVAAGAVGAQRGSTHLAAGHHVEAALPVHGVQGSFEHRWASHIAPPANAKWGAPLGAHELQTGDVLQIPANDDHAGHGGTITKVTPQHIDLQWEHEGVVGGYRVAKKKLKGGGYALRGNTVHHYDAQKMPLENIVANVSEGKHALTGTPALQHVAMPELLRFATGEVETLTNGGPAHWTPASRHDAVEQLSGFLHRCIDGNMSSNTLERGETSETVPIRENLEGGNGKSHTAHVWHAGEDCPNCGARHEQGEPDKDGVPHCKDCGGVWPKPTDVEPKAEGQTEVDGSVTWECPWCHKKHGLEIPEGNDPIIGQECPDCEHASDLREHDRGKWAAAPAPAKDSPLRNGEAANGKADSGDKVKRSEIVEEFARLAAESEPELLERALNLATRALQGNLIYADGFAVDADGFAVGAEVARNDNAALLTRAETAEGTLTVMRAELSDAQNELALARGELSTTQSQLQRARSLPLHSKPILYPDAIGMGRPFAVNDVLRGESANRDDEQRAVLTRLQQDYKDLQAAAAAETDPDKRGRMVAKLMGMEATMPQLNAPLNGPSQLMTT